MDKEDFVKLLDETLQEFYDCDGGDVAFIFEGETYHTDTGYAIEGIEYFVYRIKKKMTHNFCAKNPFQPKSAEVIYSELEESRRYFEQGEYEDFDKALDDISNKFHLF